MTLSWWLSVLNWLALPLLVGGVLLILRGAWPRRRGGEPRCRKCDYELTGLSSERCPECGVELNSGAIVRGQRRRRVGVWMAGAVLVLLGSIAPLPPLHRWLSRVDWYPYKTSFMLIREVGSPSNRDMRALTELLRREQAGRLSEQHRRSLADVPLSMTSGDPETIRQLLNFTGRQFDAGILTDQQRAQLFTRSVQPRMTIKQAINRGDPVAYQVGFLKWMPVPWRVRISNAKVLIDGQEVLSPPGMIGQEGGIGGAYAMTWPVPVDGLGDHQLDVVAMYEVIDEKGKVVHRSDRTATGVFKVVEPDGAQQLQISTDPTLAIRLQGAMQPQKFEYNLASSRGISGRIQITQGLPTDVAFEVWMRWGDHEEKLFGTVSGRSGFHRVNSSRIITTPPPAKADLILRGTEQAARESIKTSAIWKGELIYRDVPVMIHPDPAP